MDRTRIGQQIDKKLPLASPSNLDQQHDAETLRRALPYPTFEFPEKPQRELTNFTTEPKTRRHTRGPFISGDRAADFMQYLWERKLRKNCSWQVLRYEFIQRFQTNDSRIIDKYLGHPKETVRSAGSSVVRQNRNTGTIAHFMYSNERKVNVKEGLLEELGYITKEGNRYILHHESFGYFTEQMTLETAIPLPEVNGESKASIDNLCVRSLSGENNNQTILQGKECEKTVLEVVSPIEAVTERKEEEDIDSAHTNQSSESDTLGILEHITGIKLNPSEKRNDEMFERALVASISCEILRKKLPLIDTTSIVKPGPRNDEMLERALGHLPVKVKDSLR